MARPTIEETESLLESLHFSLSSLPRALQTSSSHRSCIHPASLSTTYVRRYLSLCIYIDRYTQGHGGSILVLRASQWSTYHTRTGRTIFVLYAFLQREIEVHEAGKRERTKERRLTRIDRTECMQARHSSLSCSRVFSLSPSSVRAPPNAFSAFLLSSLHFIPKKRKKERTNCLLLCSFFVQKTTAACLPSSLAHEEEKKKRNLDRSTD